jgi:hypothetical protein
MRNLLGICSSLCYLDAAIMMHSPCSVLLNLTILHCALKEVLTTDFQFQYSNLESNSHYNT